MYLFILSRFFTLIYYNFQYYSSHGNYFTIYDLHMQYARYIQYI